MPEARPLEGLRILVTRPHEQAEGLVGQLRELGASAVALPAIRIEPHRDLGRLDAALRTLATYDWVLFTSARAVELTFERMRRLGLPTEWPRHVRLGAIGPATAASLTRRGLRPTLTPRRFLAEALAEAMGDVAGMRILLPRAEGARPVLPDMLERRGGRVDEIPIYRAVPAAPAPEALAWLETGVDVVTFTSPSTVEGFRRVLKASAWDGRRPGGEPVYACIGPITAEAARRAGCTPGIVAEEHSSEGLVRALVTFFKAPRRPDRDHR